MGSILDSLFSVLPGLFLMLWIVRILNSTRKRRKAQNSGKDQKTPSKKRKIPLAKAIEKRFAEFSAGIRPQSEEKTSLKETIPRENTSPPVAENTVPLRQTLSSPVLKEASVGTAPGILERMEKLSPLARGMLWRVILDKPPHSTW